MSEATAQGGARPARGGSPSGAVAQEGRSPWEAPPGAVEHGVALLERSRPCLLASAPLFLVGPALLPGKRFAPPAPEARLHAPGSAAGTASDAPGDGFGRALRREAREALASGELPAWSPTAGLWMPFGALDGVVWLYPPNALAAAFDRDVAAGWLAPFTLLAGGAGTFACLAREGLAPGESAVGALALRTSGWAASHLHVPASAAAAVWLPWCLWAAGGVDHALRALEIPSGDVLVRTKYEPWSLRIGATITLASVGLALVLALRMGRRVTL